VRANVCRREPIAKLLASAPGSSVPGWIGLMAMAVAIAATDTHAQRPQCGTRTTAACTAPGLQFQAVSAGFTHSCGVAMNGSAWCWGDGRDAALGDGRREVSQFPRRVQTSQPFVAIGAGGSYSCGRTADGRVFCWGSERVVPGWPEVGTTPREITLPGLATDLATGRRHACVLDSERRALCWGWNVDGETGTGTGGLSTSMVPVPTLVDTTARFANISGGLGFTCGVTESADVLCWGSNIDGIIGPRAADQCGEVNPLGCALRPVKVDMPEKVRHVAAGSTHACVLTESARVFCWGANGAGQVGAFGPGVPLVRTPAEVRINRSGKFLEIASGGVHTCALTESGRVYCWGAYDHAGSDQAQSEALAPAVVAGGTLFQSISTGQLHACGLDKRGRVLCWGDTIMGALGAR
jgi:alpha-tubulin suppressor-like RCC1 family protein